MIAFVIVATAAMLVMYHRSANRYETPFVKACLKQVDGLLASLRKDGAETLTVPGAGGPGTLFIIIVVKTQEDCDRIAPTLQALDIPPGVTWKLMRDNQSALVLKGKDPAANPPN